MKKIASTIQLAIPIVIGQIGVMLMGLADTIQVGQMKELAAESLGASGMAGSIFFTVAIVGLICLQIIAPMISKAEAEGNVEECGHLLRASIRIALFLGIITIAIIGIVGWNYDLFQQTAINKQLTLPFLALISISVIPTFVFSAFKSFTDGLRNTKIAMIITVSALFFNIALNHILINGFLFFPAMGLFGAGISTLIARILMATALGIYIFRKKEYQVFFESKLSSKHALALEKSILKIGIPSGMQGFFEIATFGMAVVMMGWISITAQAAHIVAINMASLTYMAATGIAAAGGINVGTDLGEKNRKGIIISGNAALLIAIGFMAICAIIMYTGRSILVRGYTQEIEVIDIAVQLVVWGAIFQLFDGIQAVALGLLRGLQDVKLPTAITIFCYWVIGLPLSYYLGIYLKIGAVGIWMGLTASLVCSSILLPWRFYQRAKSIKFEDLEI
ncbi:MATE family efflux transporter [Aquirufa sp. ROCK2-A2]